MNPRQPHGSRRAPRPPEVVARLRLRITRGEHIAIGPGKIELLEALERCGSITAAAKSLDMSYRRAWMLLDELDRCLRTPAVASVQGGPHGGGTCLTDAGRELVRRYRHIEQVAAQACAADIDALKAMLGQPPVGDAAPAR